MMHLNVAAVEECDQIALDQSFDQLAPLTVEQLFCLAQSPVGLPHLAAGFLRLALRLR